MPKGVQYNNIFNEDKATNIVSYLELFKAEIEMLLTIPKNSLFFGNGIGIDFNKYKYLKDNRAMYNLIKSDIENLFVKYRRLVLKKLVMTVNRKDSVLDIVIHATADGQNTIEIPLQVGL